MLKIGKGLHKKKKSKKNKHKEEELFTEEELERYRKEHSQRTSEEAETADTTSNEKATSSEEFEKFKALTAGVDDILRKSQGDLDRIKKESFFQRKPTPSELKAQEEKEKEELKQTSVNWVDFDQGIKVEESQKFEGTEAKVEVQEEESESEYEDDIFDTAYVDALESGEVKLAYVPEDEEVPGAGEPDPFDTTSAAEVLRKVQEEEEKKKRQVSLGLAVQVLTGRADRDKTLLEETGSAGILEQPGVVTKPRKRPRKIQDFVLIGSFDEDAPRNESGTSESSIVAEPPRSLLDNDLNIDCELPEGDTLITEVLSKQAQQKVEKSSEENKENTQERGCKSNIKDVVNEFDAIQSDVTPEVRKAEEVEDQFDEFTALAVSSVANQKLEEELQKFECLEDDPFDTTTANIVLKEQVDPFGQIDSKVPSPQITDLSLSNQKWSAFNSDEGKSNGEEEEEEEEENVDPFDTTFVEKIQPGKCEIKLLEDEILGGVQCDYKSDVHQEARILSRNNSETELVRQQRIEPLVKPNNIGLRSRVCIQITDPSGLVETQRGSLSESKGEGDIASLTYTQRDLLGGSTTDLTKLGSDPLPPEVEDEDFSNYADPFDTSIVNRVALPGKAELKFLEKELLSDIPKTEKKDSLSDDDFDPREEENRKVAFDITSPVGSSEDTAHFAQGARPLTPYSLDVKDSESDTCDDPFDTSHLTILPGKQELRIIEEELNKVQIIQVASEPINTKLGIVFQESSTRSNSLKHSSSADDFNPREGEVKTVSVNKRLSDVPGLTRKPPSDLNFKSAKPDLLVVEEEYSVKALTPQIEEDISAYVDPFDTSIAENIVPGKAELKVLESELIPESQVPGEIKRSYTDPDFDPRDDLIKREAPKTDILSLTAESSGIDAKPLNPVDLETCPDSSSNFDPFDTTIAANLLPGKAEIRVLESELLGQ
ncbi:hypothetical protein RUM44_013974 [Polyplax serrata]|uniref:Protein stoned-A n=1 Tax=Polyplax serrata TaxID=468196 RepID=A0ABR1BFP3_POLSC